MRAAVLVLACLGCAGLGRRVQAANEQMRGTSHATHQISHIAGVTRPFKCLGMFLLTLKLELARAGATPSVAMFPEATINPHYGKSFDRQYAEFERGTLIHDCNVRTGFPMQFLRSQTMGDLQAIIDTTRSEQLVGEDEARRYLDPNEEPRVFEFVSGSPMRRSLLIGTIPGAEFIDSFVVGGADFIQGGRSLRDVVGIIERMGGLERAAAVEPWLQRVVPLARSLDFGRLAHNLMFVRRATDVEASTCPYGSGKYVEEGQHRAIAAAWHIMHMPNKTHLPHIPFLRGVNRRGHVWGNMFWAVDGNDWFEQILSRVRDICFPALGWVMS